MKKYQRDRRGRFDKDRRLYKYFLIVFGVYAVSMMGVNTIWGFIKSFDKIFYVENSVAVETITNEVIAEARIDYLIGRVYNVAKVYGVSGYQMERTIECESRFNNVQSSAYQNGVREDSWGIAQIHLPSHPDVSREEAMNEEFAIDWMAKHFNDPYVTWYGYNRKTDKCN